MKPDRTQFKAVDRAQFIPRKIETLLAQRLEHVLGNEAAMSRALNLYIF